MNGAEFVAIHPIYDAEGRVIAAPGDRCDAVPADSLPWLEELGCIERVTSSDVGGEVVSE